MTPSALRLLQWVRPSLLGYHDCVLSALPKTTWLLTHTKNSKRERELCLYSQPLNLSIPFLRTASNRMLRKKRTRKKRKEKVLAVGVKLISLSQQDASARVAPKDIICRLYKRRNCPYGRTGKTLVDGKQCEKPHPPRCFKYTRFGARDRKGYNKGANCQYCHPRLCNDSVKSQRCSKDECSFSHLKGTLRSRQALDRANNDQSQAPTRRESTRPTTFAPTTPRFSISEATPYPPTVQQWSRQGAPNRNEEAFLLQ